MTFKVEERIEVEEGTANFMFNAVSDVDGIKLWLTDYRLESGKKRIKRWSNIGDDGTFVKRQSIDIPEEVLLSARNKVIESIFFD